MTYQEVRNPQASGELGRLCGRAARAELFEGHARSGDLRAYKHLKDDVAWIKESGIEQNGVNGVNGKVNGVH